MSSSKVILEMRNIVKEFPGVRALDDVTFFARKGEILALVGENGAGKSTLMKVLSGAYPHGTYQGKILINNEEVKFSTTADSEKAGIAMIFQEISMHLDLTVAENLHLGALPTSFGPFFSHKKMFSQAKEMMGSINLDIEPHTILRSLNTSQMQLICIARALAKNPKILVLDEPTSCLTETESEHLFKILHDLKAKGITSILISHKLDEVFYNADRVTVLRDGHTVSTYSIDEVDNDVIIKDMVGRSFDQFYPKKHGKIGEVILKAENYSVPHPFSPGKFITDNVSFELHKGEILGFAGLVGAGRSELMNAIFGKCKKASGTLYIDGEKVEIDSPFDAVKNGIALVTENRKDDGFVGQLNIAKNICLASLRQLSGKVFMHLKEEQKGAEKYYKDLAIRAPGTFTEVNTLSGGNQQKVILGKWLLANPRILILDEPTKGIDIATKNAIYNIMVELAEKGMAIILISSEMPELISMSDRIVVLSSGKKAGELGSCEKDQVNIMKLAVSAN